VPASAGRSAPERSDQFQPPSHRPAGTTELRRDLVDGVALQFPDRDPPQVRVAQDLEETTIRLGELCGKLGGGLRAGDLVEPGRLVVGSAGAQVGLGANPSATALQPARAAHLVRDLTFSNGDQQPPEVVAVVQPGEAALGGGAAEAVEGTERRILLILCRPGPPVGAQSGLGQADEAGEVTLP
jgi:hypothetical protein